MGNTDIRSEELRIQGLVDRFLNQRVADNHVRNEPHLDDDSLTAFVEGNISEREAQPIVSHLVDCSFCLHVTSELVKLDYAFADEPLTLATPESHPSKVSEVLSGLLSRIFGTGDVFAHHEVDEDVTEEKESKK
ncbi:MAG: hypothetical protein IPN69_04035 [Acidobacteria bacterium]|nr:hypothetical protein [Acidobacteriota bacterium]MBK8149784.1 hypothetical protein [Acidobacteriota bacterium]MBK8809882.1 hypothetical protein [Acidobacteriota bacterium]